MCKVLRITFFAKASYSDMETPWCPRSHQADKNILSPTGEGAKRGRFIRRGSKMARRPQRDLLTPPRLSTLYLLADSLVPCLEVPSDTDGFYRGLAHGAVAKVDSSE